MNNRLTSGYFILLLISVIVVSVCYSNVKQDDAFIFFTYAKNISQGNGFVFNTSEKLNATTSPLYTLLIALFNFLTGAANSAKIPVIGNLIGFISLWFLVYYSYRIFNISGLRKASYIFPFLITANPLIRNSVGMETYLALMLSVITIYFYLKGKTDLTALFGALAILARYDSLLLILIIFIDYIFTNKKLPNINTLLIFFCPLLLWFLFSYFYFGNFLPTTLAIKINQQSLGFWGNGLLFIKGFNTSVPGGAAVFFISLIILSAAIIKILKYDKEYIQKKFFIIILIWTGLYFISYGFILNPPPYPWYYTFFMIPFGMIVSVSLEKLFTKIPKNYFYVFLISLFVIGLILPARTFFKPVTPKYLVYHNAAEWLNLNASKESDVMIDEIGVLGFYYNKGKVIDLLGLINPHAVTYLQKKNYIGILNYYKPEYLIVDYPKRPEYENFIKNKDLLNSYSQAVIISGKGKSVEIYHSMKPK